jgi:hypothetical protein
MIIDDFNVMKVVSALDGKANAVLIIYTNAVLSLPVSMQRLQMICWWDFQILQTSCIVNHDQFSQCHSLNILRELSGENLVVDLLRFFVSEALYHTVLLYLFCVYMPSRYTGNSGKDTNRFVVLVLAGKRD